MIINVHQQENSFYICKNEIHIKLMFVDTKLINTYIYKTEGMRNEIRIVKQKTLLI